MSLYIGYSRPDGKSKSLVIFTSESVVIGSDQSCDLIIESTGSAKQLCIRYSHTHNRWIVENLDNLHRVTINGKEIDQIALIKYPCIVCLGRNGTQLKLDPEHSMLQDKDTSSGTHTSSNSMNKQSSSIGNREKYNAKQHSHLALPSWLYVSLGFIGLLTLILAPLSGIFFLINSDSEVFKETTVPQDYKCDGFMHSTLGFYADVPIKIIVHGGMKQGKSLTWRWAEYDTESETYTMGPPTHHNFGHKNAMGQIIERKSDLILSYYWNAPGTINLEKCEFVWEIEGGTWDNLKQFSFLLPLIGL